MGMSASQARLLNLQARQSNLEYQGQQINQERSILSQQCTDLYNSLLNMTVPTPPSTQDFTKVQYSGVDGATTFKIGNVKPSGEKYTVEIQQSATGKSLSKDYGTATCSNAGSELQGKFIEPYNTVALNDYSPYGAENTELEENDILIEETGITGSDFRTKAQAGEISINEYIVLTSDGKYKAINSINDVSDNDKVYKKVNSDVLDESGVDKSKYTILKQNTAKNAVSISASEIHNYYYIDSNTNEARPLASSGYVQFNEKTGAYSFVNNLGSGVKFFKEEVGGHATVTNPNGGQQMIAGHLAYDFEDAAANPEFGNFDWEGYRTAIRNSYGSELRPEDFMVYFETSENGVTSVKFALVTDVESPDGYTETYSFAPNGSFTTSEERDGCELKFDSAGMITEIGIPKYDESGKLTGYNYVELKAEKVTDEKAYQDAYNEYEYAQYEYDRKQQEINAKTEVIQQQDRNLELKLQRLDNERTQITTEIEAVEKVINDNIESTYKTFSG